jgi:hypothetical protein
VYDINSNYCGDNVDYLASVTVEFFSNSSLTTPINLNNIRIAGASVTGVQQDVSLVANAGITGGVLTSNQNSIVLTNVVYQTYNPDLTQEGNCTSTTTDYKLNLIFGCSSVSTVTVQQNNKF